MDKNISYEQASKELQEIINKIELGEISIDESIKLFERGQELIQICYSALDKAKGKLTEIKEKSGNLEEE